MRRRASVGLLLGLLLALAPGIASAQEPAAASGALTVAVTPELSLARIMDHPAPEAAAMGIRLEVSRGGAVALTFEAAAWGFAVACLEVEGVSCDWTAFTGVAGIRYAPAFAVMGTVAPYVGAGGGIIRWNGEYGQVGVVRVGADIDLGPRTAFRVETGYQPIRTSGRVAVTGETWSEVSHFHVITLGLRLTPGD